jgi:hypothetical protein
MDELSFHAKILGRIKSVYVPSKIPLTRHFWHASPKFVIHHLWVSENKIQFKLHDYNLSRTNVRLDIQPVQLEYIH